MKYIYIILGVAVIAVIALFVMMPSFFTINQVEPTVDSQNPDTEAPNSDTNASEPSETNETENVTLEPIRQSVIGQSADGNAITAYHYGTGDTEILLIGGIHGGYSWNTTAVAYETMSYLETIATNLDTVQVTVIPVLNPDGLETVFGTANATNFSTVPALENTIAGRFNGNAVDLNRNFGCEWQAEGTWQNRTVSGGTAAFSEPESQAILSYVEANEPAGAVVWYSAAGGVYSSNCRNGVLPVTAEMTDAFAVAAGYPAYAEYDYYEITGDMANWFSAQGIPGISVLLTSHQSVEADKNIAGVNAIITYFQTN